MNFHDLTPGLRVEVTLAGPWQGFTGVVDSVWRLLHVATVVNAEDRCPLTFDAMDLEPVEPLPEPATVFCCDSLYEYDRRAACEADLLEAWSFAASGGAA
jgi:hypothetical protein